KAHKKAHAVTIKDATIWSVIWIACAMAFGCFVYWNQGRGAASGYLTGYVMEKALAIDNLFAFFLIFKSFGLATPRYQPFQHMILYWGILGAILFRVLFLGLGALIVNLSDYVLIGFAVIVLWTVYKMWRNEDNGEEVDYTKHWSVNLVKRFTKVNPSIESRRMFSNGATPLFLCLVCIEICDVVFAFDSMPVIVAVVKDPYLMITSSLWAAAGLRSLYFLLIAAQNKFWALEKAVMVLLIFVSAKLIGGAFGYHLRNEHSLIIVGLILAVGIIWSLARPKASEIK
ncbi:MAG: tellurium resistance protein TerC, partial [Akkermansiaceae bacterium]|nr:tellurium resistance protein TerC [Akkermansiaceae bacterium]